MIHLVDAELRREALRYKLAFTCERCVSFDSDGPSCSLGFPIEPHHGIDLERAAEVVFCKTFELA